MSRVLVIHAERGARRFLEARSAIHHQTQCVDNLSAGMKAVAAFRPDVIMCGLDGKKGEALDLLRYLRRNRIDIPVLVVAVSGAGIYQSLAMKLGAAGFVEYPIEQDALDQALSKALQSDKDAHGTVPPITREELNANLSELEKQLNRHMSCFAGKNKVYLQSMIQGGGYASKPRIALKCPLRKEYGYPPNVYYEYIRDVCCKNPPVCPAYQEFMARNPR
jgi:DNA-binding NarL/FixJ family response regulator